MTVYGHCAPNPGFSLGTSQLFTIYTETVHKKRLIMMEFMSLHGKKYTLYANSFLGSRSIHSIGDPFR